MSHANAAVGSAQVRPAGGGPRLAVPWRTALPLAVGLAYTDGFWLTSLRGAVGAIATTQEPFVSWLRESTLFLPLYVLAVLGAIALALRWFGPAVRGWSFWATTSMVVVAGTLASVVGLLASAAYSYHLQTEHLRFMAEVEGVCGRTCLDSLERATLGLHAEAVGYGTGIILVTNLVVVLWLVALRGGRLDVSSPSWRAGGTARQGHDVAVVLTVALLGSAVVHAAVVPEHVRDWPGAGLFFALLAAAQLAVAAWVRSVSNRASLSAAAWVSAGPVALWLYSRTFGIPFGPEAGQPEPVGLADVAATLLEIVALVLAVLLLVRAGRRLGAGRAPASAHGRWLAVVAVVAVTALGLGGSGLPGIDLGVSAQHPGQSQSDG